MRPKLDLARKETRTLAQPQLAAAGPPGRQKGEVDQRPGDKNIWPNAYHIMLPAFRTFFSLCSIGSCRTVHCIFPSFNLVSGFNQILTWAVCTLHLSLGWNLVWLLVSDHSPSPVRQPAVGERTPRDQVKYCTPTRAFNTLCASLVVGLFRILAHDGAACRESRE